jgi:nucleotide-binding universal stress UspA family protein
MYRHILLPVDLSDRNTRAVETAAELASATGARVTLLHIIEAIEDAGVEEFEDFYRRLQEKAEARLRPWAEQISGRGVPTEVRILYGRRAAQIVAAARAEQADLIVLSSHRIDLERAGGGWGTLSYQVAVFADCAVLLVK